MKSADLKGVAERNPFRPFTVRLNNGTEYEVQQPRDFGAPQDYRLIFYFGDNQAVLIDPDSIVEVIY